MWYVNEWARLCACKCIYKTGWSASSGHPQPRGFEVPLVVCHLAALTPSPCGKCQRAERPGASIVSSLPATRPIYWVPKAEAPPRQPPAHILTEDSSFSSALLTSNQWLTGGLRGRAGFPPSHKHLSRFSCSESPSPPGAAIAPLSSRDLCSQVRQGGRLAKPLVQSLVSWKPAVMT